MKSLFHPIILFFTLAALIVGLGTALIMPGWLVTDAAAAPAPELKVESAPIGQELRARTSLAPVVQRIGPSVVNIYAARTVRQESHPMLNDPALREFFGIPFDRVPPERRQNSLGSGVIVSADGYILTNSHVVQGADQIRVALADERTVYDAKVVGTDPQTDIAVIKVDDAGKLPAATLADSDTLQVGDLVIAVGNPFGVGQTVTSGIVSAKSRGGMGIVDYEDFIQTDASINPGNSGGALVDAGGRVVGINTAILSRTGGSSGVGFAIPVNLARYVLERIVADGKVTRGYLGVTIQEVTSELAKEFDLPESAGALVGDVLRDSPAEKAGLQSGDVIIEVDNRRIEGSRHLRLLVAQVLPGTSVKLKVIREGKEREMTATLDAVPEGGLARAQGGPGGLRRGGGSDALKGVTIDELDSALRRQFNLPERLEGVIVTEVDPTSPAAAAGLRHGDVIVEIDRQPVRSVDDAIDRSRRVEGDRVLLRVWSRGGIRFVVVDASRGRR